MRFFFTGDRYWLSHLGALRMARRIAAETGIRQRVLIVDPDSNRWACPFFIAPADTPAVTS